MVDVELEEAEGQEEDGVVDQKVDVVEAAALGVGVRGAGAGAGAEHGLLLVVGEEED